jgi:lysophospholipase L1-like esterase
MPPSRVRSAVFFSLLVAIAPGQWGTCGETAPAWAGAMRTVHQRFKGKPGTLAQFGDSITDSLAYWTPLLYDPKGMSPEMSQARDLVVAHMRKECWREWKGPEFGNHGRTTIAWADENVAKWLAKLQPEVVVIMFGTNDLRQSSADDFERRLAFVARSCLRKGSVVILTTPPPHSGMVERSRLFAEAVRRVAKDLDTPLVDYQAEILKRRPDDWDGSLPQFKGAIDEHKGDVYQVPTLISGDGVHPSNPANYADWSEEALRHNGFNLRSYLTLMRYAEVLRAVIQPEKK